MESMRRPAGATLLAIIMVPIGIASLWASFGPARVAAFTPWLVAGWTCVACGLAARRVAAWSLEWTLLVTVGITWLLPDIASCLNVEPLSHRCVSLNAPPWLAGAVDWLWLGIAGHAIIGFPDARVAPRPLLAAVVGAYVLSLGIGVDAGPARPLLAVLLVAAPLTGALARRDGDVAAWAFSTVAGIALAAAVLLDPGMANALEAGIVGASLALLAGLAAIARARASLTADLAVELGPAIAAVVGDPTFQITVRAPHGDGWMDTSARTVPAPSIGDSASTPILRDGIEIARLNHDFSTLADPDIRAAVVKAVELAAHNARLRTDLEAQADAVASSRRRLLDAALREREALGSQVEVDVMRRLDRLAERVRAVPTEGLATEAADRLRRAAEAIGTARAEVNELALGVYPQALADLGLLGALRELAASMPIEVRIDAPDGASAGRDVDATLYFLCAEALANAARHARASSVRIGVVRAGADVVVTVEDDGVGGAVPDGGTGLRGLRDRVEALAGSLEIVSPPGGGTRLVATVPAGHEAR